MRAVIFICILVFSVNGFAQLQMDSNNLKLLCCRRKLGFWYDGFEIQIKIECALFVSNSSKKK